MGSKESKKIVKLYNKIARALVEFETLWHQVIMPQTQNPNPRNPKP